MKHVNGESFRSGDTVTLDDCLFSGCSFVGCTIVYNGGMTQWSNCHFDSCAFILGEAANRTKMVIEALGFKVTPPTGGVEVKMTSPAIH
jgi:hypothetical protein